MCCAAVATFAVIWYAVADALIWEQDNRTARRLEHDKKLMLKLPALQKKLKTEDCLIQNDKLVCTHYIKGNLVRTEAE